MGHHRLMFKSCIVCCVPMVIINYRSRESVPPVSNHPLYINPQILYFFLKRRQKNLHYRKIHTNYNIKLTKLLKKVKIKTIIVSHLCRHFNQHQQLFNADPQALALYIFSYHGPFFLIETAQQLCKAERDTGMISAREKHLNSVIHFLHSGILIKK